MLLIHPRRVGLNPLIGRLQLELVIELREFHQHHGTLDRHQRLGLRYQLAQQHLRLLRVAARVAGGREQQSIAQLCTTLRRTLVGLSRCSENLGLLRWRRLCQPLHGLEAVGDQHRGRHVAVLGVGLGPRRRWRCLGLGHGVAAHERQCKCSHDEAHVRLHRPAAWVVRAVIPRASAYACGNARRGIRHRPLRWCPCAR